MRFPEFTEEWVNVSLKDVADFQKERISSGLLDESTYISTENILQNFQGVQSAISIPANTNVVAYKKNDILLSNIRPYLKKVWFSDRIGGCSADVFVLRSKTCEPEFLYNVIASDKFINYVMSGAKGGREASQGACNVIEQVFQEQYAQCGAGQEGAFLKKALISANRYVFNKAAHEESLAGMGTTAVCALVRGGEATLCHAGDSRAYLCRGGKLTQLTHDHSYVQELVDCGTITVEEAEHHPQKNIITKALGVDYRLDSEFTTAPLQKGDILLLCSDGLTNAVPREQLEQLLRTGRFYDLPDLLIRTANENGGPDNITALLLCVEEVR